jgi:hypothetical protein
MNEEEKVSTFEMSLKILGNELIGLKIIVDDFKTKWLMLTVIGTGLAAAIVSTFGESIKTIFTG